MPRINDVGGQDGFGPVLEELDEPPFHADWEAHVFAMNRALIGRGLYNLDEFRDCLAKVGCVLAGQTAEIAPGDKVLYALRDVTATVESIPLITASILSKKLAEGLRALVLDVKFGGGAFMKDPADARKLAESLVAVARANGLRVEAWTLLKDH